MEMKKTISIMTITIICIFALTLMCEAGQVYHTKAGFVTTHNKADLDLFINLVLEKDYFALGTMLKNGRVSKLLPGKAVYIKERSWPGKIRIRSAGSLDSVWTFREAVE